eukprot:TRINITY_DN16783_c3_g1_i1.p1 TRINITY_DN16783_c3_g1~~TRINITY_DN16783_c3_g1_i1.p1  ORF type:complete len:567 (+),score=171.23 TRINITY_DN16783_c3_g1_i1:92-1702(+)
MAINTKLLLAEGFDFAKRGEAEEQRADKMQTGWLSSKDRDVAKLRNAYGESFRLYVQGVERFNTVRRYDPNAQVQRFCAEKMEEFMGKCDLVKDKETNILLPCNVRARGDGPLGTLIFERRPEMKVRTAESVEYEAMVGPGGYCVHVRYLDKPGLAMPAALVQVVLETAKRHRTKYTKRLAAYTQWCRTLGVARSDAPARLRVKVNTDSWMRPVSLHVTVHQTEEDGQQGPAGGGGGGGGGLQDAAPPAQQCAAPGAAGPEQHTWYESAGTIGTVPQARDAQSALPESGLPEEDAEDLHPQQGLPEQEEDATDLPRQPGLPPMPPWRPPPEPDCGAGDGAPAPAGAAGGEVPEAEELAEAELLFNAFDAAKGAAAAGGASPAAEPAAVAPSPASPDAPAPPAASPTESECMAEAEAMRQQSVRAHAKLSEVINPPDPEAEAEAEAFFADFDASAAPAAAAPAAAPSAAAEPAALAACDHGPPDGPVPAHSVDGNSRDRIASVGREVEGWPSRDPDPTAEPPEVAEFLWGLPHPTDL